MSQEPKKVDRRSFLYVGLGAVALIALGAAAYIAMNPPVVTQTTTVPTTTVITQPTITTSVITTTIPPSGIVVLHGDRPFYKETVNMFPEVSGINASGIYIDRAGYLKKLTVDVMSGAEYASYDVCETVALLDWVQAGYVRPLEDLPGFDEVKERSISGSVDFFTYPGPDGKTHTWAIPFYTSCQLFYYRTDLLEKAGYSKPPRTYNELLEYSKTLTKGEVYGYVIDWADDNFVYRFAERMLAAGGKQLVNEYSNPQWNNEAGIRALSWMRDMWQSKVVVPESINIESSGVSMNIFLQGTAAFTQNWTIVAAAMDDPNKSAIVGKAKANINLGDVIESASVVSYGGLFIPKKARNVQGAWEYIKFITSEERQLADLSKEGYLPSIKSIYKDPTIKTKYPYLELVDKQCTYPQAQWEKGLLKQGELFDIFNNKTLKLAITGQKSVEAALKEAEELYLKVLKG